MSRAKPRLPHGLDAVADAAGKRMLSRQAPPRVLIEKGRDGWRFSCPYAKEEEERWFALLADAFGTRSGGLIDHFLECIIELVPEGNWNNEKRFWYPSESAFNAVLAIISSLRPENEAQAAHAAQMAALHLASMKLGEHAARYGDPRTVATFAKTTRAFGEGMERLARLQGKVAPRTTHQTFEVHKHEHVHFDRGGVPFGGQPHATTDAGTAAPLSALPSPCEDYRATVPSARRPWKAGLQDAWRTWWRSLWRAERKLEARRLDTRGRGNSARGSGTAQANENED